MHLLGQVLEALQTFSSNFGDLVSIQVKFKQGVGQTWTSFGQVKIKININ